jgi:hypothetical protein
VQTVAKVVGVLFAVVVAAIVGLVWYVQDQEKQHRAEQDGVTVSVSYEPAVCNERTPILLKVVNDTRRTVKSVNLSIEVFEEGRSDNLAGYDGDIDTTDVVRPGSARLSCWRVPSLKRSASGSLRLHAAKNYVEFYSENEFIPPDPTPPERTTAEQPSAAPSTSRPRKSAAPPNSSPGPSAAPRAREWKGPLESMADAPGPFGDCARPCLVRCASTTTQDDWNRCALQCKSSCEATTRPPSVSAPASAVSADCGCNGDLMCLMKCPSYRP